MPQLGETVADGTVTKWFKSVGDVVKKGDALFEISTDKVDTEIPSPADGVLTEILVTEGTTVDVGTILARIGQSADAPATVSTPSAVSEPAPVSAPVASAAAPRSNATATIAGPRESGARLSPVVRRLLSEHGLTVTEIPATGPAGRLTRNDVLRFIEGGSAKVGEMPLSPVVRRLLTEKGLAPSQVRGTGPNGRITRHDVEQANAISAVSPPTLPTEERRVPFNKLRRLTAEHMTRSKATSAHTLMVKEVDFEAVDRIRRTYGAEFKEREGFSLTYLPFNATAVELALREFPHLNASVGDNELILHPRVNLGIAVDLDAEGLVVPVLHDAGSVSFRDKARQLRALAVKAREKKLTIDDISKGTFTITNPGPYGTLLTGAVINQPQVAILSTDTVQRKPVVVTDSFGNESIAIHSVGLLALTFDHRAIDGGYAAKFLSKLAEILTTRDWASDLRG